MCAVAFLGYCVYWCCHSVAWSCELLQEIMAYVDLHIVQWLTLSSTFKEGELVNDTARYFFPTSLRELTPGSLMLDLYYDLNSFCQMYHLKSSNNNFRCQYKSPNDFPQVIHT